MMASEPIPLYQIKAFEAAARCLSFSRAAQELNVQQPAVSRQIAALEADLGQKLFVRTKPHLKLTEEGELLAEAVDTGFGAIREGLETLRGRGANQAISVSASIGFTSLYLLPRLAGFQAEFPDVKLQIITRDQNADFDPQRCDAVIQFGENGLDGAMSRRVFAEAMVAVCHPDLLQDGVPFDLATLAEQDLLHLTSADHIGDWNRFFSAIDHVVPKPSLQNGYLSYMVYLRAIQQGLGIGIGWRPMLTDFLSNGSLMLACEHECRTNRGFYCSLTPSGKKKAGAKTLLNWIGEAEA